MVVTYNLPGILVKGGEEGGLIWSQNMGMFMLFELCVAGYLRARCVATISAWRHHHTCAAAAPQACCGATAASSTGER